jgi:cytochrome c oxidase subunit 2
LVRLRYVFIALVACKQGFANVTATHSLGNRKELRTPGKVDRSKATAANPCAWRLSGCTQCRQLNLGESMQRKFLQQILLAAALVAAGISSPVAQAQDSPKRIEITAKRFNFEPGEITLKKGQPVVLVLKSADVGHGLHIRELNVDVKVGKGGTAEVKITPDKTGDFMGHCSVFCGSGHGSMAFKVHVVD